MAQSRMLKSLLFYPLMFLRPIAKMGLRFFSVVMFIGIIVGVVGERTSFAVGCGVWSFLFFLLSWSYDTLLLKLNPSDTVLVLNR